MKKRMTVWWNTERKKISGMSGRQAVSYIWEYYKIPIVGAVCLVCTVLYLYAHFRSAITDHWIYVMFANTREQVGNGSELWDGYVAYTGYDTREKAVDFNCEAWFDYLDNQARGNRYYEMFCGFTDNGVLDAVTMEADALTELGRSGRLMDLTDERCRAIFEKYGDRLLYSIPYDTEYSTDPVPVGIDISDSILMTKYHIYPETCALGIGAQSGNIEAVEKLLDYLYEKK